MISQTPILVATAALARFQTLASDPYLLSGKELTLTKTQDLKTGVDSRSRWLLDTNNPCLDSGKW